MYYIHPLPFEQITTLVEKCDRVVQEWVLDLWNDMERQRLNYFRIGSLAQRTITQADIDPDPHSPGTKADVHIPASFTGGKHCNSIPVCQFLT